MSWAKIYQPDSPIPNKQKYKKRKKNKRKERKAGNSLPPFVNLSLGKLKWHETKNPQDYYLREYIVMANRVQEGITKFNLVIDQKLESGELALEKVESMAKSMDMDWEEYSAFQTLKSLASMNGQLSLDEAQLIYSYLGETLDTFNSQSLAVKYVLSEVFASLVKNK